MGQDVGGSVRRALYRTRGDVHREGEERGVEKEGHDAVSGDGAADLLSRNAHVGDLRGHADDQGEVDKVPVVRLFQTARERHPADAALVVELVRVVQCEHRMDESQDSTIVIVARMSSTDRRGAAPAADVPSNPTMARMLASAAATVRIRMTIAPSSWAAARRRIWCTSARAIISKASITESPTPMSQPTRSRITGRQSV